MKKIIIITIAIVITIAFTAPAYAMPKGIDSRNYNKYVKPNPDMYGYNKGECKREYLPGEELFYNEYYDHWNVDLVYDSKYVSSKKLAIAFTKANYPKYKIKFITLNKKGWKKILHRKSKKFIYIEKCVSKSSGKRYGYTLRGHHYIVYNKRVPKGKLVTSYCIWNPKNNACDDVVAVVDNKMVRSDYSY